MLNGAESKRIILVKYGEIALRKGNREIYERQVMDTIRHNLAKMSGIRVLREQGRFLIEDTRGDIDDEAVIPKIKHIFGIAAFCVGIAVEKGEPDFIRRKAWEFFEPFLKGVSSFKVETKRGDKQYPFTSNEISAAVGGYILEQQPGLKVSMNNPERVLWAEVRNRVYFYTESLRGEGGLPYGSSGKGVLLLSGGIDSPVAGYLTARRGVEIVPVYFHSPPYTSERAAEKVSDLARRLSVYTGGCRLYTVPFTQAQIFLYENIQPEKLTILLKRAMLSIASMIAQKENARALITGDCIGQVASQTIPSIEAVNSASAFPVLRPLAAMDKQWIIETAKRIETYDISIRPYDDCCTLFVAKHPESKPKTSVIEGIEKRVADKLIPLLTEAFENSEVTVIN